MIRIECNLTRPEYTLLIECIHNSYLKYGKDGFMSDLDVYLFNSELDKLINKIKKGVE